MHEVTGSSPVSPTPFDEAAVHAAVSVPGVTLSMCLFRGLPARSGGLHASVPQPGLLRRGLKTA